MRSAVKAKGRLWVDRRRKPRRAPGFGNRKNRRYAGDLTRAELVRKYEARVRSEAWKIVRRGGAAGVEVEDLVSMGFLGLMDAAEKFDAGRGVKFETYAEYRIRGAMLDELRRLDWVPRSTRDQAAAMSRAAREVEEETKGRATETDVSDRLGISLGRYQRLRRDIGALSLLHYDDVDALMEREPEAFQAAYGQRSVGDLVAFMTRRDARSLLLKLLRGLGEPERQVLTFYYFRGLNQAEIGRILEISESRVSQIHKGAILKLRRDAESRIPSARRLLTLLFAV